MVCLQAAYAINKEDIEVLGVPLASLAPANALAVAGAEQLKSDLGLRKTADGMDGTGGSCRCANLWAVYRDMRAGRRSPAALPPKGADVAADCTFGAPLVGWALQRLGALAPAQDVSQLTPAKLLKPGCLTPPAGFGKPLHVRTS